MSWDQFLADLGMQSGGAVRVSLGLVTNFADVYRLVQFAQTFLDTFRRKRVATPASLLRTQRHEFNRSDEQKILLS